MRKFLILLLFFVTQNLLAGVVVTINDGVDNVALKNKMEKAMSEFLTEANNAQSGKRDIRFAGLGLSTEVQSSISMLWENCPFVCAEDNVIERCLTTGTGYQVRNIPLMMRPIDNTFTDDEYQEAVFSFDRQGNVESFYLTLSQNLYMNVIKSNMELTDLRRRQLILDYVEHFRTSYNQKDIQFLQQVFSDDALIITGKVIKQSKDGIPLPDKITYKPQTKQEYLSNLRKVFSVNKHIKVTFDEIEVSMHPVNKDFYGVTLHQGYTSDRYHDDGYIFLLWDFRNENAPQIHVRTWQPDRINGNKLPKEDIFTLGDFDI